MRVSMPAASAPSRWTDAGADADGRRAPRTRCKAGATADGRLCPGRVQGRGSPGPRVGSVPPVDLPQHGLKCPGRLGRGHPPTPCPGSSRGPSRAGTDGRTGALVVDTDRYHGPLSTGTGPRAARRAAADPLPTGEAAPVRLRGRSGAALGRRWGSSAMRDGPGLECRRSGRRRPPCSIGCLPLHAPAVKRRLTRPTAHPSPHQARP